MRGRTNANALQVGQFPSDTFYPQGALFDNSRLREIMIHSVTRKLCSFNSKFRAPSPMVITLAAAAAAAREIDLLGKAAGCGSTPLFVLTCKVGKALFDLLLP